jgi:hypothetical protein
VYYYIAGAGVDTIFIQFILKSGRHDHTPEVSSHIMGQGQVTSSKGLANGFQTNGRMEGTNLWYWKPVCCGCASPGGHHYDCEIITAGATKIHESRDKINNEPGEVLHVGNCVWENIWTRG